MTLLKSLTIVLSCGLLASPLLAEETTTTVTEPVFVPDAGSIATLRDWTLEKWMAVRKTNHPLYHYVLNASRTRAYLHFCKRHDLKVDLGPVNELALRNLGELTTAHYEEEEWANLAGQTEEDVNNFIADLGHDIYAFEYAMATRDFEAAKEKATQTTQAYCASIEKTSFEDYIALRANAKRQLGR